jgi:hypothetical protein
MKNAATAACLAVSLSTAAAFGQAPQLQPSTNMPTVNTGGSNPVAYVYVSARIGSTDRTEIHAFSAAPDGRLSPVQGSPFPMDVTFMAVNGLYLFGSDTAGTYIHAYSIQPDGSLRYTASTNVVQPENRCDSAGALLFDHTGATLYNVDYFATSCSSAAYQGFAIQKSSGKAVLVNEAEVGISGNLLSFIGDNRYAYGADCVKSSPRIYGYARNSDGSLTNLNLAAPLPAPPANQNWCPEYAAADRTSHLAVAMHPSAGPDRGGPDQLAAYTVDSHGGLSTRSTYADMPKLAVGHLTNIYMAPSGKLLAVAGAGGLQIFHFNGDDPVTAATGLVVRQEVDQMYWDKSGHLYAIGQSAGKLWVFTVTPTGYSQAPGSPYSINDPQNIVVQPWPLPWSTAEDRAASHPTPGAGATPGTLASIR